MKRFPINTLILWGIFSMTVCTGLDAISQAVPPLEQADKVTIEINWGGFGPCKDGVNYSRRYT